MVTPGLHCKAQQGPSEHSSTFVTFPERIPRIVCSNAPGTWTSLQILEVGCWEALTTPPRHKHTQFLPKCGGEQAEDTPGGPGWEGLLSFLGEKGQAHILKIFIYLL